MIDPLLPHLLDIASDPASEGLILAGGFGIRLKQAYLREAGEWTLISVIPEARATQDLDFFLSLSLFVQQERGAAVRALFNRLGYAEYTPKYQFGKPFDAEQPTLKVKVDLLARSPIEGEDIRVKWPRVGAGSGIDLHGRETPEGFAVEDQPLRLAVRGIRSDGMEVECGLLVPHPYAWINLKVKAAHDWLRMERGEIARKPRSERHVIERYGDWSVYLCGKLRDILHQRLRPLQATAAQSKCAAPSHSACGTVETAQPGLQLDLSPQTRGRYPLSVLGDACQRRA